MSISTTNLAALSSDKWNRTCPCLYPLSRRRRWSRARLLCRQTTLMLLEKDRSTRSRRWFLTPKSIRTDVICMNPPPRVQRGHVRRPGHSPQRTVSDDRRRGKHDEDCSDSNCGGGLGLRRGCDRRMRSSSLARSRDVPCSGRRKRHIRISETSTWISTRILCKSALLGGLPSGGGLSRRDQLIIALTANCQCIIVVY